MKLKEKPMILCAIMFSLCLFVRFIEYFAIRTDETIIGENFIHKLFGILLLFIFLKNCKLKWEEIGFRKENRIKNTLLGLLLGLVCFGISYGVEITVLSLQGNSVCLEFYASGFSLTGEQVKHTGIIFVLLCIVFNAINVCMEEGVFRGFYITSISSKYSFMKANIITALLFGVWHFVMPVRSFVNGETGFSQMLFLCIGYIILSEIMSIKWGLLYKMTGSLWVGIGDHFFNNAVATNLIHVVTNTGADEMQIIRIMLAQLISFVFTIVVYSVRKRNQNLEV